MAFIFKIYYATEDTEFTEKSRFLPTPTLALPLRRRGIYCCPAKYKNVSFYLGTKVETGVVFIWVLSVFSVISVANAVWV
jgi:hypothetical protein